MNSRREETAKSQPHTAFQRVQNPRSSVGMSNLSAWSGGQYRAPSTAEYAGS